MAALWEDVRIARVWYEGNLTGEIEVDSQRLVPHVRVPLVSVVREAAG